MDLIKATFLVENLHSEISTSELLAIRMRQLNKHPQDIERAAKILKKARLHPKLSLSRDLLNGYPEMNTNQEN